jgi:hypothetical protein
LLVRRTIEVKRYPVVHAEVACAHTMETPSLAGCTLAVPSSSRGNPSSEISYATLSAVAALASVGSGGSNPSRKT